MIKAAFFDIDGTLLSFRTHRVSEGTVRAFRKLHEAGVRTFISSGRPKVLIPPMPVSFDGHITMNGGLVFTPDKTLYSNPIPQEDTHHWLDYCTQHNICTMLFTETGMMAANVNEVGQQLRNTLEFEMPPLVAVSDMYGHKAFQLIAIMPSAYDAEVSAMMPHCRLPRWSPVFSDIVAASNSKAVGMEAICQHFGIAGADTIAFGDGGNDIEMLQWAGVGVAMGNASDEVKAAADITTTDVDNEGIETAINQLLA